MDANQPVPVLMTIAKSGTHLLSKLVKMLTKKDVKWIGTLYGAFRFKRDYTVEDGEIMAEEILSHGNTPILLLHSNNAIVYQQFIDDHPSQKTIVNIRDLRDALISCLFAASVLSTAYDLYYKSETKDVESLKNDPRLLGDLLTKIMTLDAKRPLWLMDTYKYAANMAKFINDNRNSELVYVSKFESLVGSKGGGSDDLQTAMVQDIAKFIGVEIVGNIKETTYRLFGNGDIQRGTFREGQIGSWSKHFTEEHKRLFNERFGPVQLQLGYELCPI